MSEPPKYEVVQMPLLDSGEHIDINASRLAGGAYERVGNVHETEWKRWKFQDRFHCEEMVVLGQPRLRAVSDA